MHKSNIRTTKIFLLSDIHFMTISQAHFPPNFHYCNEGFPKLRFVIELQESKRSRIKNQINNHDNQLNSRKPCKLKNKVQMVSDCDNNIYHLLKKYVYLFTVMWSSVLR